MPHWLHHHFRTAAVPHACICTSSRFRLWAFSNVYTCTHARIHACITNIDGCQGRGQVGVFVRSSCLRLALVPLGAPWNGSACKSRVLAGLALLFSYFEIFRFSMGRGGACMHIYIDRAWGFIAIYHRARPVACMMRQTNVSECGCECECA